MGTIIYIAGLVLAILAVLVPQGISCTSGRNFIGVKDLF